MADILELVAGWIVAGLVTVAGVILAQRSAEKARQRQEDRIELYQPLRKEMEGIVEDRWRMNTGLTMWSPSDFFSDLRNRGRFTPRRHDALRAGIDQLLDLRAKQDEATSAFYDARESALKREWEATTVKIEGPQINEEFRFTDVLAGAITSHESREVLSRSDKEAWTKYIRGQLNSLGQNKGGSVKPSTDPETLFDRIAEALRPSREDYRKTSETLIEQARTILARLDRALQRDRQYRP